ncbi:hypothetical protein EV130_102645 [Rhizobium azibense]|uniref:Uncharacterized protein n=1 Tax=Rhizobium azibense TaxID=1136135 RepID=A0A4R3RST0_9HYPH|nr:hypothetical protein EV130_102645 [Rhizobium azibense]TCU38104.1 hypothetical protein EV129_105423 [Rhizobium azibense]
MEMSDAPSGMLRLHSRDPRAKPISAELSAVVAKVAKYPHPEGEVAASFIASSMDGAPCDRCLGAIAINRAGRGRSPFDRNVVYERRYTAPLLPRTLVTHATCPVTVRRGLIEKTVAGRQSPQGHDHVPSLAISHK